MVLIHWQLRSCPSRLRSILKRKFRNFVLTYRTLTFNTHMNMNYGIDILFEPIFWFVDNFAQCLGPFFVFCVSVLTASVVFIAYWVGLPYWLERSPNFTIVLVLFGNWLLWNICFHYYKGVVTSPGHPPEATLIVNAASICRKCISPKPPRTHHCSVCDRCVLNMDHHCPWLNNCVGYFNARHFFLYMAYMVLGVLFVILAGLDIGYVVLWLNDTGGENTDNDPALEGHSVRLNQSGVFVPVPIIHEYDSELLPREHDLPPVVITEAQKIAAHPLKRKAVIYMALLNVAVLIALGSLTVVHGKQIHRAETSVEYHINETEKKTFGKRFRNPYDFGPRKNWKIFLGLTHGRTFFWNVIIPSGHKPVGTGLHFHTINDIDQDWP